MANITKQFFFGILTIITGFPAGIAAAAASDFKALTIQLGGLIDLATFALFGVAIMFFFWSVVQNLWGYNGGDAEKKKKLQETLFWGVLIIFVMVSIWGIISILQLTLSRGLA